MILLAIIVVALLAVVLLGCLAWCWDEPVRRGSYVELRPKGRR